MSNISWPAFWTLFAANLLALVVTVAGGVLTDSALHWRRRRAERKIDVPETKRALSHLFREVAWNATVLRELYAKIRDGEDLPLLTGLRRRDLGGIATPLRRLPPWHDLTGDVDLLGEKIALFESYYAQYFLSIASEGGPRLKPAYLEEVRRTLLAWAEEIYSLSADLLCAIQVVYPAAGLWHKRVKKLDRLNLGPEETTPEEEAERLQAEARLERIIAGEDLSDLPPRPRPSARHRKVPLRLPEIDDPDHPESGLLKPNSTLLVTNYSLKEGPGG